MERNLAFRAYVDPSPSAAADLFARLSKFIGPPTPIAGVGDQAYFDKYHGLHVPTRKQLQRFALENTPDDASFGANGGAVDGDGLSAGDEGNDSGYFLGCFETLEK
jgi:hypothetical protein